MKTTAAKYLAKKLHQAGCRQAFGMPGGEVLIVMQALAETGIEFTLCKHENAAGFMAEGSWHASGAPGILLTTIGPGLANGVNSVANALQEQVPLIVISGCVEDKEAQSFTHQIIDQKALMKPVTKAHFQVAAGNIDKVINKAIAIAVSDPPGPVHIDVPHNVADSDIEIAEAQLALSSPGMWPDGSDLNAARKMLKNARRPIILAGLGAVHHDAGAEILKLCENFSVPLITTYKAKGIMDENHPLCLGGHGLSPLSDAVILPLLAQSDCIILAGYDPIEMRSGWIEPWDAANAIDLVHADIQHGMHGADVRFVGDVAGSLAQLSKPSSSDDAALVSQSWPDGEIDKAGSELEKLFDDRDDWGPHQVFATTRKILPDTGIATIDSGAHRILLSQMWKCSSPHTLLQSTAFCTMGISLPLAIGYAKTKTSQRGSQRVPNVVVFVGDAGLEMVIGELATIRDLGLAIVIVVLVDRSLSLIDLKQSRSNLPNLGVDFGATDFVSVANAYGGNAQWIDNKESLEKALTESFDSDRFTLLACNIDKRDYLNAF
ncbi:MAG: thiamine pyrophosphate-binding protein [Hyphomicrobiales bacterium]|nr:thiamine pyrophosphate-binding protein [Hyphomicrobiales bacterium]